MREARGARKGAITRLEWSGETGRDRDEIGDGPDPLVAVTQRPGTGAGAHEFGQVTAELVVDVVHCYLLGGGSRKKQTWSTEG